MNRRDWLVKQGLAKPGRGKFSNAAKEALAKAEEAGTVFSDGTGNPSKIKAGGQTEETQVVKVDPRDSTYILPSDFRFPVDEYVAKEAGGKVHSMRECCNSCKVSLTNHACNSPTIHGNIPVTIVRR